MPPYLQLILGLAVLTLGAEGLVRGASRVARRLGLSELIIGLTVVAFGTSAPELAVSVKSALAAQGGIAMGNVIGSNIFNVAVVLGLSAMIAPLVVHLKVVRLDMYIMLAASLIFSGLLMSGGLVTRLEGGILLALGLGYTIWSVWEEKREARSEPAALALQKDAPEPSGNLVLSILMVLAGLAMLVGGAKLLVDGAVVIARTLGMSETVIGLTIVAAGTSLPELATSLLAAWRKQTDIAIGNVVGSNIFNALWIAGCAALVAPIDTQSISRFDLLTMLGTSLLLLPFMRTGFKLARWEGLLLFSVYAGYLYAIWPK